MDTTLGTWSWGFPLNGESQPFIPPRSFFKGGNPMSRHHFAGIFGRVMLKKTGSAIKTKKLSQKLSRSFDRIWAELSLVAWGKPETSWNCDEFGTSSILRSWGFLGFTSSCRDTQGTCLSPGHLKRMERRHVTAIYRFFKSKLGTVLFLGWKRTCFRSKNKKLYGSRNPSNSP